MGKFWPWLKSFFNAADTKPIDDILRLTLQCCGYLPTVATVAKILSAGNPAVVTATAVASGICIAVQAHASSTPKVYGVMALTGPPTVFGVEIEGGFIR